MKERSKRHKKFRHSTTFWLSCATFLSIFVVNTLGFTDTVTGSAMGCGNDWPLCNGEFIPSKWGMATGIEYTHRVSVVLASVLLVILAAAAWRKFGSCFEVRILLFVSFIGVLIESILGALSVMFINPPAVMAAHLGIAMITFVGIFLLTLVIGRNEKEETGWNIQQKVSRHPLNGRLAGWIRFAVIYGYMAIYFGAYVADTGYGSSFQGLIFPTESFRLAGSVFGVDLLHRSAALGFLLLMIWLVLLSYRERHVRPDLFRGSLWGLGLVCLQAGSGMLLIYTHLSVFAFLLHVTIASFLFAALCYLELQIAHQPARLRRMFVSKMLVSEYES